MEDDFWPMTDGLSAVNIDVVCTGELSFPTAVITTALLPIDIPTLACSQTSGPVKDRISTPAIRVVTSRLLLETGSASVF